jgi:hypothetical protein
MSSADTPAEYRIQEGGYRPEVGHSHEYQDSTHHFWFYAFFEAVPGQNHVKITVNHATSHRMAGASVIIRDPAEIARVERNIRDHFQKRGISGKPRTAENPPPDLCFTWRLQE